MDASQFVMPDPAFLNALVATSSYDAGSCVRL